MEELARRAKERVWLKNQSSGELDDAKLVDGLAGDRLVYKKRGSPEGGVAKARGDAGTSESESKSKSKSKSEIKDSIYSLLLVSCFVWSIALYSSDVLQLYSIASLA